MFADGRQPHLQLFDSQRHASLGHPQEQFVQSQVPQQVVLGVVCSVVVFRFVIVFSYVFLQRLYSLS